MSLLELFVTVDDFCIKHRPTFKGLSLPGAGKSDTERENYIRVRA